MDEINMERTIRETLHTCADGLHAPDALKTRIDYALRSGQTAPRRRPWGKRLAAALLVAAVAVTGAVAGSGVVSWGSSSRMDKSWRDFDQTAAYVQEHVAGAKTPASFTNGFSFKRGCEETVAKRDESGNVLDSFTGLLLEYKKGGTQLMLNIEPVQDEGEYTSPYDTVRTVGETEVHYRAMRCIFLPPDGSIQPTAAEQAAADRGEINIAYGSDTREEQVFYTVSWIDDALYYALYTYEPGDLTEDDFFAMAGEIIGS